MRFKWTATSLLILAFHLCAAPAVADEPGEVLDEPGMVVGPAAAPGDKVPTPTPPPKKRPAS